MQEYEMKLKGELAQAQERPKFFGFVLENPKKKQKKSSKSPDKTGFQQISTESNLHASNKEDEESKGPT